jgi:hypothetical protein
MDHPLRTQPRNGELFPPLLNFRLTVRMQVIRAFTLTVNGSNFNSTAVVKFNGTNQTTTFVTGKQLTAAIPASAIATAGTMPVSVTNPGTPATGGPYGNPGTRSETSNVMNFTVN